MDNLTANYQSRKRQLARLLRLGASLQELREARDDAFESFDQYGWPDDWARWQRAVEDAQLKVVFS